MQVQHNDSAFIEIRDNDKWGEIIAKVKLKNDTYPPSIVTKSNSVYIKFHASSRKEAFVYMELITSPCKFI